MKESTDVSRRKFLKGSAVLGAGAAGAALFGTLNGCTTVEEKKGSEKNTLLAGSHRYAVHEADAIALAV